jgi:hypothetical protein
MRVVICRCVALATCPSFSGDYVALKAVTDVGSDVPRRSRFRSGGDRCRMAIATVLEQKTSPSRLDGRCGAQAFRDSAPIRNLTFLIGYRVLLSHDTYILTWCFGQGRRETHLEVACFRRLSNRGDMAIRRCLRRYELSFPSKICPTSVVLHDASSSTSPHNTMLKTWRGGHGDYLLPLICRRVLRSSTIEINTQCHDVNDSNNAKMM